MKPKLKRFLFFVLLFLLSLLLLGAGIYFNRLSKPTHVMGSVIDYFGKQFSHYFYPDDDLFVGNDFTLDGNIEFDLDSEYYRDQSSQDEEARKIYQKIQNFNQLQNHFLVKQKEAEQQGYAEIDAKIGEEELIQGKLFIQNATEYYYIHDAVKNYVNNGTCNYFENIYEDMSLKDNVDYLYEYFFTALKNSMKEEYFEHSENVEKIQGKEQKVAIFVIRIDDKRFHEILSSVLESYQNDPKASKILMNAYPDFMKKKISKDTEYLKKDESYTLYIYTTRFLYKPLKYEIVHLDGDFKENFIYEGSSSEGNAYYVKNDRITYQMPVTIKDNSFVVEIQDSLGKAIGEAKIEKDGYNQTINYSFITDNKNYDLIYSSKYTEVKKNKTFKNTKKMSFKFVEDKVNHFSGDIVFQMNAENLSKIEEDVSMATLASRLSEEEKDKVDHKWETIKNRLEQ